MKTLVALLFGICLMFNGMEYNSAEYNSAEKTVTIDAEVFGSTLTTAYLWFSCTGPATPDPDPPEGTPLYTIEDLQKIGNDAEYPLDGDYYLANDIDASGTQYWNGGAGFAPIGSYAEPFTGTLDGQGYAVDGLVIARATPYTGLISASNGALLSKLKVTNCDISGSFYVGGLCGYFVNGEVSECSISGTVTHLSGGGGLIGFFTGLLSNVYSEADVITSGNSATGGLIGQVAGGTIVFGYSVGEVSTSPLSGGLIGSNSGGTVTSCYYDSETSGQSDTGKGEPKTTAQMKMRTTFVNWDFLGTWEIVEGVSYPTLQGF